MNAILNTKKKTLSSGFFKHHIGQLLSPCYHSFLTVTQSYHSKMTHISELHAEKIPEAVLLYVFRIAFPASLLVKYLAQVAEAKPI